jgi:predicted phage baseplate assembly protein
MPLEDSIPRIDDRRFDDIIAEVRTRIARYTPEWAPVWTDVNDSDPGITMVQVFAWMTEMLTYRMAKVPELNYLKFLQLLGMELNPAESALAEITFPQKDAHPEPYIIIPERTQVSAESPEGGPPVVFETERALTALTMRLTAVQAFDGYAFMAVTDENTEATQGFQPFGPLANDDSALLLGFKYPPAFPKPDEFPRVEINLAVWVVPDTTKSAALQCGLPDTPAYGPARIQWEFWSGDGWGALSLLKDETRALTRTGHISLKAPAKDPIPRVPIGEVQEPLFWIRGRVERSQYERPPKLLAIRMNTVAARQAETILDEVLGGSNGRRDQVFRLGNTPVVGDSSRLEVDEGSGYQPWTRVDDLFGSGANDPHYVLNRTNGEIRFGDGVNGRIPVANVDNATANVIAREYRFGGGKRGNVLAGALQTLVTSIDGVDANAVGNLLAAHSGRDEETLEQAKKRAPHTIRSRCRAVTVEDYELLAMQAANIKRAKALPLFHPDFPGVKVPGVVTIIVVPDGDGPHPTPSEGTLRTVCAYLDQRRLLTTEVYVIRPTYQQVEIRAEVIVKDDADLAEVHEGIEKSLLTYFHPLTGGEDGQGWLFGGTIFYSRVYQRVFTITGVQSIQRLAILLDGEEAPACTDVSIKAGALVYSMEHHVQVQYSFEGL